MSWNQISNKTIGGRRKGGHTLYAHTHMCALFSFSLSFRTLRHFFSFPFALRKRSCSSDLKNETLTHPASFFPATTPFNPWWMSRTFFRLLRNLYSPFFSNYISLQYHYSRSGSLLMSRCYWLTTTSSENEERSQKRRVESRRKRTSSGYSTTNGRYFSSCWLWLHWLQEESTQLVEVEVENGYTMRAIIKETCRINVSRFFEINGYCSISKNEVTVTVPVKRLWTLAFFS